MVDEAAGCQGLSVYKAIAHQMLRCVLVASACQISTVARAASPPNELNYQSGQCDEQAVLLSTNPVPQTSVDYWATIDGMRQRNKHTSKMIVLGDSILASWRPNFTFNNTNLSVPGDKTQNLLFRMEHMDLEDAAPSEVVVMIGTNNLGSGEQPCAVEAGIRAVVKKARELWPKAHIILFGIIPRGRNFDFRRHEISNIDADIDRAFEDSNVTPVMINDQMTCSERYPCDNYLPDDVHPTAKGLKIIQKAVSLHIYER